MFTAPQSLVQGFLNAVPVNLALVLAVLAYPDYAWDIIAGAGSFAVALLLPSLPWPARRR